MSLIVDMDISFHLGQVICRHIYLYRIIPEVVQVDVADLIVLAKDPEPMMMIQPDGEDIVIRNRAGIILFVTEEHETLTIITFDAPHRAQPEKPLVILLYGGGDIGCQAVLCTQMGEKVLLLGR